MKTTGLCKVDRTPEKDAAIISIQEIISSQHQECLRRLMAGEFHSTKQRSFLFVKWDKIVFNEDHCKRSYPELFEYAYIFDWDCHGGLHIHTGELYSTIYDIACMIRSGGDMFLTPYQCRVYASAKP